MREGRNESEAVRAALVEAGDRRMQRAALAEEVRRLAADEDDPGSAARPWPTWTPSPPTGQSDARIGRGSSDPVQLSARPPMSRSRSTVV
jgi:hypothetical protein